MKDDILSLSTRSLCAVFLALGLFVTILGDAWSASVLPKKGVVFPSPHLEVSGKKKADYWTVGFHAVYAQLLDNLKMPRAPFTRRYAQPSPIYKAAYLWDTAFISQVWKTWDPSTAQDVNMAVMENADPEGRLKHLVSAYSKSELTQPPVMAWAVWEIYLWHGDREYLAQAYLILKKYNWWLYQHRRLANGLFFWQHPYESGIDNSPRFGSRDEYQTYDTSKIAAVDLASYMARQNETLALMAQELGHDEEAETFLSQATEVKKLINELLWHEQDGLYYDLHTDTGELARINTIASFFPLFCAAADEQRAARLLEHIMNKEEYNTYFPLPSVARNDPRFEKDCWRGPVWINTAYMVLQGLMRYGFHEQAADLAFRVADGVYRNYELTHEFVEFYDPDKDGFQELHRKRGNLYKRLTLGDKPRPNFVGWTGLANNLVIEYLIGFHQERGNRWLEPRFPSAAAGLRFQLIIPGQHLELDLEVMDHGATKGSISCAGQQRDFFLAAGERLDL